MNIERIIIVQDVLNTTIQFYLQYQPIIIEN